MIPLAIPFLGFFNFAVLYDIIVTLDHLEIFAKFKYIRFFACCYKDNCYFLSLQYLNNFIIHDLTILVKFIPGLILIESIMKGSLSTICFSVYLLLVYRKTTDLCKLILRLKKAV